MTVSVEITKSRLHFPVKTGAPKQLLTISRATEVLHQFQIELAPEEAEFWVWVDVHKEIGSTLTLSLPEETADLLLQIQQSDDLIGSGDLYQEPYRPGFHFSSQRGWLNDPNGLVYAQGVYHLFYQHNPYGWHWGNMHWGHAISSDLVHWKEVGEALYPDELGTIFSGSAVVDTQNSSGLQSGEDPPILLFYTNAGGGLPISQDRGFSQSLAYSPDGGTSWLKWEKNPIIEPLIEHNRDPRVIWHQESGHWVMLLYMYQSEYGIFRSQDLKTWNQVSIVEIQGSSECPDLFQLSVDGDPGEKRWVLWGADGRYLIGEFDGQTFTPQTDVLQSFAGETGYAAQTWQTSERCVQIMWARQALPGMPFNQFMTFPCELSLRKTRQGLRLCFNPVQEIGGLQFDPVRRESLDLLRGQPHHQEVCSDLYDLDLTIALGSSQQIELNISGTKFIYSVAQETLQVGQWEGVLPPIGGQICLRILVDRCSIEVFGNNGEFYLPLGVTPPMGEPLFEITADGGQAQLVSMNLYQLQDIWTDLCPKKGENTDAE